MGKLDTIQAILDIGEVFIDIFEKIDDMLKDSKKDNSPQLSSDDKKSKKRRRKDE